MKRIISRVIINIGIFIGIISLITFPVLTNKLMLTSPPFGWVVAIDNEWIGFFASYFGCIFGGLLSGIFTYLGVKMTINDQMKSRKEEQKIKNRAHVEISEIYSAELRLTNVLEEERRGRLVITPSYRYALDRNMIDGNYNFIKLNNNGPGLILNVEVNIGITLEINKETRETKVFLPTINVNEKVFIPIDPIPDTSSYRIAKAEIKYKTLMNEELKIIRSYELKDEEYIISDTYFIKDSKGDYNEIYSILGSKDEWLFI